MKCAEDYFKFLCKWILDNCPEDMKFVSKRIDKTITHRLEYMTISSYDKISYGEAVEILRKVNLDTMYFLYFSPHMLLRLSIFLKHSCLSFVAQGYKHSE